MKKTTFSLSDFLVYLFIYFIFGAAFSLPYAIFIGFSLFSFGSNAIGYALLSVSLWTIAVAYLQLKPESTKMRWLEMRWLESFSNHFCALSWRIYGVSFFVLLIFAFFNGRFSEKIVCNLETNKDYEVIVIECDGDDCESGSSEIQRMHVRDLLSEKEFQLTNKRDNLDDFKKLREMCSASQIQSYADRLGPCRVVVEKNLLGQYSFVKFY